MFNNCLSHLFGIYLGIIIIVIYGMWYKKLISNDKSIIKRYRPINEDSVKEDSEPPSVELHY